MRLVMMGTGSFAAPTFASILESAHQVVGLVTQPDRVTGKERASTRLAERSLKDMAIEREIPVLQPESINTAEGVAALSALQPELLVVAAYGQILSKEVLNVAKQGGINVHASLLPKYRGAAPINWAIYHGEKQTGVSIIRMSTALDAGDILAQEVVDIGADETAGELEARLAPLGAKLAVHVIDQMALAPVVGVKQDKSLASKAPKLKKEDGLIDWTRTAEQVCRQIRAMQPWPTAYTFLHEHGKTAQRLIVLRAKEYVVQCESDLMAGTIIRSADFPDSLLVAAGLADSQKRTVVEVLELQPAGKRRMTAKEFLRGHALPPGSHVGAPAEQSK